MICDALFLNNYQVTGETRRREGIRYVVQCRSLADTIRIQPAGDLFIVV